MQGRHLRHLKGIAVRNISSKPARVHRRSNDDENLVTSWRSPGKLAVHEEGRTLTHSRSAIDLSTLAAESSITIGASSSTHHLPDDSVSEGGGRPIPIRRRNTRSNSILAGTIFENATTRQRNLVDATLGKLVDTFFTLHHDSVGGASLNVYALLGNRVGGLTTLSDDPFYISETVPSSIVGYTLAS